ncbi:MAG: CCA tRNA nucleotidyltransferase [Deltaproteobacteria bacterium]
MSDTATDKRQEAARIVLQLRSAGFEAYFVGGCVRDFVMGVVPADYDIVTSAIPDQVIALFNRTVAIGAKFGVVAVIVGGYSYEVATFRSDDVYIDGRRPSNVHFTCAKEDVFRRDFTVNGLLMDPVTGEITDYVDGLTDIQKKIIRTIGDPDKRFQEDHLRMLRAIRFTANLNFKLDSSTQESIAKKIAQIQTISAERIQDELNKLLTRGGARRGLELMAQTEMLREILPEVGAMQGIEQPPRFHPEGDVWQHTLMMMEILSEEKEAALNPVMAWGALLHDVGKPVSRTEDENGVHFYGHVQHGGKIADGIMHRLKFSRAQRESVLDLILQHMNFMNVQKMRPARLKRFLRMPDFDLHLELHRLDCLASHGMLDNYEFCRNQLENLTMEELHPPRLLTGDDLIALGFTPGKIIGEILRALEDEQMEGRISSQDEAKIFVEKNCKILIKD